MYISLVKGGYLAIYRVISYSYTLLFFILLSANALHYGSVFIKTVMNVL